SHARPNISAYAYLWGQFDFDRTPLAPIGCEVQCHEKASDRGTWAEHTVDGWFLGSSQEHYRAFHCYIKATKAKRICDTVQFMHRWITQPALTAGDAISRAAHDLIKALKSKPNWLNDGQAHDLQKLGNILSDVATSADEENSPAPASKEVRQPRVAVGATAREGVRQSRVERQQGVPRPTISEGVRQPHERRRTTSTLRTEP
ncbi:hypothetical protein ACHAWF_002917, partial [Thalassiosira exigua]